MYWRQRQFLIPYQPAVQSPLGAPVAKVRLLAMREGANDWATLQEADASARGFTYHAPDDGEYAFAVQLSDHSGNVWPRGSPQPQLKVIVDTEAPTMRLAASRDFDGQIVVRYEASDRQLRPETLRVEATSDGTVWEPMTLGPPDVSYPDRLLGQFTWKPRNDSGKVLFRAAVSDQAGNQAATTADLAHGGLSSSAPAGFSQRAAVAQPSMAPLTRPAVDWPTTNSIASPAAIPASQGVSQNPFVISDPTSTAPPLQNPYTPFPAPSSEAAADRTPAQFAAGSGPQATMRHEGQAPAAPPLLSEHSPSLDWTSIPTGLGESAPPPSGEVQWINALTVDIEYELQTVGPWGVGKVELWATRDHGQSWSSLGVDSDNRSPFRATVPGPGEYGFRIVVEGVNGSPASPPRSGDLPELLVGVDLEPPRGAIVGAKMGEGPFSDQLIIHWTAVDEHLGPRPITLRMGETSTGPWRDLAAGLQNVGEFKWRLTREPPKQLYLQLEVRDVAGNAATYQTPTPIVLTLPEPTGRVRAVRPVTNESPRDLTADRRQ